MNLQMLKKSMLAYVSAVKFVWSSIAYPLSIVGKKLMNLRGYRIYGNSTQCPVGGKNFFNVNNASKYEWGLNFSVSDGVLTVSHTTTGTWISANVFISEYLVEKKVTISSKVKTSGENKGCIRILWMNNGLAISSPMISSYYSGETESEISATGYIGKKPDGYPNAKLCIAFYLNTNATLSTGTTYTAEYSDIQIEIGDTATEWESYKSAPSPEYPSEIECVGDLSTKNLFDVVNRTISVIRADEAYNPDTNTLKISSTKIGQYQANYYNIGVYSELKGKTLTVSYKYKTSSESKGYIRIGYINNVAFSFNDISSIVDVPNSPTEREITATLTIRTDIDESNIKNDILVLVLYSNADGNVTDVSNMWIEYRDIQIEEGTTATDYEPYHKYKIPVVARGKNLLPTPTFSTFTQNGVKFTNNKDGSITINGTPTAYTATPNMYLPNSTLEVLRNNVCVLTGFHYYEKNIALVLAIGLNGNWIKYIYLNSYTYKNYVKVDLTNVEFDTVVFAVRSQNNDILINNLTVKPLLEVGTTMPTSFEPYIAPITTNIFLNEPLRKVGDYADYIDYENQKVVRNVEVLDDTGTKTIDESLGVINPPIEETVKLPALPQFKGTTIYEVQTNTVPSGIEAKYC